MAYEADLWGKAPFYGRPRGFVAQLSGAWQRTRYRPNFPNNAGRRAHSFYYLWSKCLWGHEGYALQGTQQYLDPWAVQGTLFIPVLPTYSNNLAGSASITAQYFIGQGVSFLEHGPGPGQLLA